MSQQVLRKVSSAMSFIFLTIFGFLIIYEMVVNSVNLRNIMSRFALVGLFIFIAASEIIEHYILKLFKQYYNPYMKGVFQITLGLLFIKNNFDLQIVGAILLIAIGIVQLILDHFIQKDTNLNYSV